MPLGVGHALCQHGERRHEFVDRLWPAVCEFSLEVAPDELIGVQLGRIAGEALDVDTRMAAQEVNEFRSLVDAGSIPEDDHVPAKMTQQVLQEVRDLRLADVLLVEMDVETDSSARRAYGDCGDGGDLRPLVGVADDWSLASRCPGAPDGRYQQETTLVQEYQVRLQAGRFFLTSRQR